MVVHTYLRLCITFTCMYVGVCMSFCCQFFFKYWSIAIKEAPTFFHHIKMTNPIEKPADVVLRPM